MEELVMEELLLKEIEAGAYFSDPVYLDERYILLAPDTPLTAELKDLMLRWEFRSIRTSGTSVDKPVGGSDSGGGATYSLDYDLREQETMREVGTVFRDMVEYTEQVFTNFVTKNELPLQGITNRVKTLIEKVKEHRPHILRFAELPKPERNYVVVHSVRTTILAIAIGQTLRQPPHKLMELAIASLLHEIGMIRLPAKLYMSDKQLAPQEKKAISAHTVLGFKILKSFAFPMPVCLGVLESHERLDGTGYPRGLTADKISLHAKVIAVASSYAAITSERPYREAGTGHEGILELLRGRNAAYDETVIRALVMMLSLYPIGTYVLLSNGAKGMVVQTSEEDPKSPRVRVMLSPDGDPYMEQPLVDTTNTEYRVSRALNPQESTELRKKTG